MIYLFHFYVQYRYVCQNPVFFTVCNKGKASLYPLLNLELQGSALSGELLPPLQTGWKCWLRERSYTVYIYTCQLFLSKSACDFCILNARISGKHPFQSTKTFRRLAKTAEDVPMNFEGCRIQQYDAPNLVAISYQLFICNIHSNMTFTCSAVH